MSLDAPVFLPPAVSSNNTHSVRFGDNLQLSCPVSGTLPIKRTWFHNGVQLIPNDRISIEPLGQLTVRSTSTRRDSGVYQCYVENEAGFTSYTVLVDVFSKLATLSARCHLLHLVSSAVPPSFTVPLKDIVFFEGDLLALKCEAAGAPPPQYTWYRGNIALDGKDRYDTSTPGMLKMADINRDQAGTYNCSVSSVDHGVSVGRNSSSAKVFVVRKLLSVYCRPGTTIKMTAWLVVTL